MKKDLCFEQIHPFMRYARFLEISRASDLPPFIPYDCRLFYTYRGRGRILVNATAHEMPKGSLLAFQSATPYTLLEMEQEFRSKKLSAACQNVLLKTARRRGLSEEDKAGAGRVDEIIDYIHRNCAGNISNRAA